ncbi:hypothetical protein [Hydrogenophaga intermedia]|uniref:hypothetical protein n=1 Tax=Hydrogenophaga intermedia TaxID=65786 RepID=UPI002044C925|nr:hypothetical protein [Hydrogenophaga intermedia]MCM3565925.1 hypothetical protein [Hydrogenophaga intermedia]
MKQLQQYTYTIPANGSVQIPATNDNFIIQESTGPLTVRGDTFGTFKGLVAGQGLKAVPFQRLELFDESGAPNTVKLLMTPAEFVNQTFSGSVVIISGALTDAQLRASPVLVRADQLPTGNWRDTSTVAVNTPITIFNAAANVNGAIIHHMEASDVVATAGNQVFIAKATAPANISDGEVIAQTFTTANNGGTANLSIRRENPVRIEAGLGFFFISGFNGTAGYLRNCRYTLL